MKELKIITFLNNLLNKIESFPCIDKYEGTKKRIIGALGWIFLIFLFFISVILRILIEFQYRFIYLGLLDWCTFFTFFIFAYSSGFLVVQSLSGENYSKVLKLILIGFIILIQLPAVIDFLIIIPHRQDIYKYVYYSDIMKYLLTYFTDPSLNYASELGHVLMYTLLISMSSFLVFFKSYYDFENKKTKKLGISISKSIICGILIYLISGLSMGSIPIILTFLTTTTGVTSLHPEYLIISYNFYFLTFIFLLIKKIKLDEKSQNQLKMNEFNLTIKKKGELSLSDCEKIENSYKSQSFLKMCLILLLIFSFEIFIFYVAY
ncbi:MAG: hypothetical protein ACTSX4_04015 [Candidatus Helarchaeota archaeon]